MMKTYLSIDIGGTNVKYALLDRAGRIIEQGKVPTAPNKEAFFKSVDAIVEKYKDRGIKGLAFCAPGKITDTTIHFGGALPFLDGVDFSQRYQSLNIPIAGINDGKASVLAESWLGNLKGVSNAAAITLGTGVGGGLIVNGRLVQGAHFQAGELSFMNVNQMANGFDGYAGSIGSAVKMINKINEKLDNSEKNDGLAAFKAINDQDKIALKIFNDYCNNIAQIILNLQSVVDLEKIAIGGGISAQPTLIKGIRAAYNRLLNSNELISKTLTPAKIVEAKFKNNSNIYGALYNLLLKVNHESL